MVRTSIRNAKKVTKKAAERPSRQSKKIVESDTEAEEAEGIYEVERIVDKSVDSRGRVKYLIKWNGYPSSQNTWEPAEDVFAHDLIQKFEEEYARKHGGATSGDDKFEPEAMFKQSTSPVSPSRSPLRRQGPIVTHVKTITLDSEMGQLQVHAVMSDGSVKIFPGIQARKKFPDALLDFYESRLSFKESNKKSSPKK